jgi:general secretion pathway protein A
MFLEHFALHEAPFSISPDPRFVYLSERHRDALAHLLYGVGQVSSGGFVQLTGEVGTGKTTICRLLLEQLPENTRVALILNPMLSPIELLEAIGKELHIPLRGKQGHQKRLIDALNVYLLQAYSEGLRVVLIIDEAQNLSAEALEQVRLLTNLETNTQKLLQIILLGQPELRDILAKHELRQLSQRITARFHLTPLNASETEQYLQHRFAVAGGKFFPFSQEAVELLFRHSGGIPRLINIIADRALLAAYVHGKYSVQAPLMAMAAAEVLPVAVGRKNTRWFLWSSLFLLMLLMAILIYQNRHFFGVAHVLNS